MQANGKHTDRMDIYIRILYFDAVQRCDRPKQSHFLEAMKPPVQSLNEIIVITEPTTHTTHAEEGTRQTPGEQAGGHTHTHTMDFRPGG